jgi:hypothetical protein
LHGTDWVLAESRQVAVDCTTEDVLHAYLSGALQTAWNDDKVLDCRITLQKQQQEQPQQQHASASPSPLVTGGRKNNKRNNINKNDVIVNSNHQQQDNDDSSTPYYQQDLVLKSQRVITSHTGIMRYSQKIVIDKICNNSNSSNDNNDNKNAKYCVSIQMMDPKTGTATTEKKPFEALYVHVNVEPYALDDNDMTNSVYVYAAGLLKVNRKVVPNLVVFDASGIAGSMAGKGTLWLTAYFQQRQLEKQQRQEREQQDQDQQQQQHTLQGHKQQQQPYQAWSSRRRRRRCSARAAATSTLLVSSHRAQPCMSQNNNREHGGKWLQQLLLPPWSI